MSDYFSKIWAEKYRPQTLEDLVLSDENREFFTSITDTIPHMLFCSPPGQGKTTLAKIIAKDILKCQYLYINASDENGVDDIRNKVITFAQTRSIDGKIKVVLLDECLDENTIVSVLRDGIYQQIAIKNLDPDNDLVKSYSVVHDRIEYRPFTLWNQGEQDVYEIEFENDQKIICTGSHKWYVKDPISQQPVRMKLEDIIRNNITAFLTKSEDFTTDTHK